MASDSLNGRRILGLCGLCNANLLVPNLQGDARDIPAYPSQSPHAERLLFLGDHIDCWCVLGIFIFAVSQRPFYHSDVRIAAALLQPIDC